MKMIFSSKAETNRFLFLLPMIMEEVDVGSSSQDSKYCVTYSDSNIKE